MTRSHGHRLLVGAVSLVRGRVRGDLAAGGQARDVVEALMGPEFFENAPFDEIGVIFRYGERTCLEPEYQRIGRFDGVRELPIAVELEMSVLRKAKPEEVFAIFRQALLDALIAVADKYLLRADRLREERSKLPTVIQDSPGPTDFRSVAPGQAVYEPTSRPPSIGAEVGGRDKLLKLHKQSGEGIQYWETWEEDSELVLHHGTLGDTGRTERVQKSVAARQHVEAETAKRRSEGYREIVDEDHATVVVQYQIVGWGSDEDLSRRETVKRLLDRCLGWTGLGHCEGSDWGSGTTNLFCLVVDRRLAVDVIVGELKKNSYLEGVTIASEVDDQPEVHWPPGFQGQYSY